MKISHVLAMLKYIIEYPSDRNGGSIPDTLLTARNAFVTINELITIQNTLAKRISDELEAEYAKIESPEKIIADTRAELGFDPE